MQKHVSTRTYSSYRYDLADLEKISASVSSNLVHIRLHATGSTDDSPYKDSSTIVMVHEEWRALREKCSGYIVDGYRFARFYTDAVEIYHIGGIEQYTWAVPFELIQTAVRRAWKQHLYLERKRKRGAVDRWGYPIDTEAVGVVRNSFRHLGFWTPAAKVVFHEDAWDIYRDNPAAHQAITDRVQHALHGSRSRNDVWSVHLVADRPESFGFSMINGKGKTVLVGGIIKRGPNEYSTHT